MGEVPCTTPTQGGGWGVQNAIKYLFYSVRRWRTPFPYKAARARCKLFYMSDFALETRLSPKVSISNYFPQKTLPNTQKNSRNICIRRKEFVSLQ